MADIGSVKMIDTVASHDMVPDKMSVFPTCGLLDRLQRRVYYWIVQ